MNRVLLRWLRVRVAWPAGESSRVAVMRRAALALAVVLLVGEVVVAVRYSGNVGTIMIVSTAGLGAVLYRGLQSLSAVNADDGDNLRAPLVDAETRLPTRQHLIDTLSRDIARSQRYSHSLTLAVVRINQFDELKGSWGAGTATQAVHHVADTLRRVTRASDFLARLDEGRFAVVLLQCSGRQSALFADRLTLAVSNRPLKSTANVKVPHYVGVEVSALEYDATRYRGPLEFLSLAGGDVVTERPRAVPGRRAAMAADPRSLREQLVRDYYPNGEVKDFADAYREARNRNRHAG
ncbi:MAG: diguanylate cyclase [Dehalococcoidia bacterium]|nr:diguanylate cyclase [Dehalococcoidia bacterium]